MKVAAISWKNYRGRQKALENSTNILFNGSLKYNERLRKQKKTKMKKKDDESKEPWNISSASGVEVTFYYYVLLLKKTHIHLLQKNT